MAEYTQRDTQGDGPEQQGGEGHAGVAPESAPVEEQRPTEAAVDEERPVDQPPVDEPPTEPSGGEVQPAAEAGQGAAYEDSEDVRAEAERLQAERAARKQARLDALRPKPAPAPEPAPVAFAAAAAPVAAASGPRYEDTRPQAAAAPVTPPAPAPKPRRTTDEVVPSFGLFMLRLAVAALMAVSGMNNLLNPSAMNDLLANTVIPTSTTIVMLLGAVQVAVALLLVLGLFTRIAGLVVTGIAGATLAFVLWGPWSIFRLGEPGFIGDREVLLTASGLLLLCVGAGGWSVDRGFRKRREARRSARDNA